MSNFQKKLPPYGKELATRFQFNNHPLSIFVCIGADSWNTAKRINATGQSSAVVIPGGEKPSSYAWHLLRGQIVVIHWSMGPTKLLVAELAKAIAIFDPQTLIVYPSFVDYSTPIVRYDESLPPGKRWVDCRETIQVFHSKRLEAAA